MRPVATRAEVGSAHLLTGAMMRMIDIAWTGVAGLCGGIVWLIIKQHVSPRMAIAVCVVSGFFGIFVGDLIGEALRVSKAGAGFLAGIGSMKLSVWIADGSFMSLLKNWLGKKAGNVSLPDSTMDPPWQSKAEDKNEDTK